MYLCSTSTKSVERERDRDREREREKKIEKNRNADWGNSRTVVEGNAGWKRSKLKGPLLPAEGKGA